MSHTRGPWHLEAFDEESGQARIAQRVRGPGPEDWGRSVWMYTGSEADARLIAAAPDLLEAAERVVNYAAGNQNADNYADVMDALVKAAQKARGAL